MRYFTLRRVCRLLPILLLTLAVTTATAQEVVLRSSDFGSIKARPIGPAVMSGRITAIDCVTSDPRQMIVGTAGGGVWKSLDGGITFTPVFTDYTMSIGCVTIDPNDPETVWVGTGEVNVRNSVSVGTGLYVTHDGAKTWENVGFGDSERIARVIVHPTDSKTVYVAVLGHLWNDSPTRGVYKTTDGGKTWNRLLYVNEKTGCADLAMDPQEPDVLYAAMWQFRRQPWFFTSGGPGSGLHKSTDGGKTWKVIRQGLPEGDLGRIALAIAPSRPGTLYAKVEAKENGLYRSDDMGESWRKVSGSSFVTSRPFYFSNMVVDPQDHQRLYVCNTVMGISTDGGKSFSTPLGGGVHPDFHAIWVDSRDPNRVIVGTDGGVYVSTDQARHFRFLANLPVSQFYHVSYDQDLPYHVYGGLQDNGAWYGPARSYSSFGIQNKDWSNVGGGDGFYVYPHPTDPDIIYYSWQGGRLERYNRRTHETKDIKPLPREGDPDYRFNWNAAVSLSPTNREVIYIGAQFLFRSRDRGDSWEMISPDLTTNNPEKLKQSESGGLTRDNSSAENHCTIVTIGESPLDSRVIWVGTDDGNVQVTRDGGNTWGDVTPNIPGLPPATWCSCIEPGHHAPGTAWATFDGHQTGDMTPYVFQTTDFGASWAPLAGNDIEGYCHVVREDLQNPALIFLGTEFGLYVSIDGGTHWAYLKQALPRVAVRDLVIQPRQNDLIIATHGLGIQIIDDITPLRALTPDILGTAAAVLPSRPAIMEIPTTFQEFPGDGDFSGQNPREGAILTYYLKKRHIFGDLKLEILDASGRLIKTLPTSKNRGVNRISWDMRLKAPKTAASPGLGAMIFQGPMVPEGEYTIRLIKGTATYEGKINLQPDPLSAHSPEDRHVRHQTVMALYDMQIDLGYLADNVTGLIKQLKALAEASPDKKLAAALTAFSDRLDTFHKSIVQHEGRIAGDKLREKVIALYSSVIQYGGRPSDSQQHYLGVLQGDIAAARKQFDTLCGEIPRLNTAISKAGLQPLKLMSKEEYRNQE